MDIFVRQGDSLWHYSQLFKINLQLINDSNQDIQPNQLSVGQRVRIPGFVTEEYQVKNADTLWGIAKNRHQTHEALYLVNPNLNPNNLQVGQIIKVPPRVGSLSESNLHLSESNLRLSESNIHAWGEVV
jgi:g-D-glutamyl-meso-diaminopimelate peptidase